MLTPKEEKTPRLPYPGLDAKTARLSYAATATPAMQTSRLADTIKNKTLEFDVDVLDAVFNKPGRYFIKMTIQSLFTRDYSSILLRRWPYEEYVRDYEALTSVVTQKGSENNPEICIFEDKKFTFRLPEGFCKNDLDHDVYLLLEAFTLPTDSREMGKKVGEGKVAIYPRTNAPRTNHEVNAGEDMYRHSTVVSLLRTSTTPDKTEMHCGRMRCEFALREFDKDAEERKRRQEREEEDRRRRAEREREERERRMFEVEDPFKTRAKVAHTPELQQQMEEPIITFTTPTEVADDLSLNLPRTPTPEPVGDGRQMIDSPLPDTDNTTHRADHTWRHTARVGYGQLDVIVHGATHLPMSSSAKVPQPFVTLKTRSDVESKSKARARTHAVVRPSNVPSWEELLSMELTNSEQEKEDMVLTVGDAVSKEELVNYDIPVKNLKPFHPYHTELTLPSKGKHGSVKLYVSIMRKLSSLPKDPASPNYLGLEVFLRGVKHELRNPVGPLIAVARIVPDYYNYQSDQLLTKPRVAGVTMSNVAFPQPKPQSFVVHGRSSHGYPQLSLPGRPEVQPKWNHPYLFCDEKDKATMFTPSAALVIEYYVANSAMTDFFWKIQNPVGFSSLLLNEKAYHQLKSPKATSGLRVENVPILGSELRRVDGKIPVVGMVLKLITTDQPESMVVMSNLDNLPEMEMKDGNTLPQTPDVLQVRTPSPEKVEEPEEEEEEEDEDGLKPGLYLQRVNKNRFPQTDDGLPSYDAVETILPEYQYIFVDRNNDTDRTNRSKPAAPSRRLNITASDTVDLDQTQMTVLDQQSRDLDNYRTAVHRMGQDILTLRGQVRDLEGTNHRLKTAYHQYDDHRKLLIDASDLDSLARPELQKRYAQLRQKLAQQTTDLKEYKSKVQRLQNELIKKNDKEKDYLRMTQAHASQQELLQRLQEKVQKVRKLEETCKKQEKVIERLEGVLHSMKNKSDKGNAWNEANSVLQEENKRLRQQIDDLKDQMGRAGISGGEDLEKLELYQALERAEGRVLSLEKQLTDNARNWGKERADMNIKMNEAEHGFGRTGGMVLHDYPVLDANYSKPFSVPSRLGPLLR